MAEKTYLCVITANYRFFKALFHKEHFPCFYELDVVFELPGDKNQGRLHSQQKIR